MKSKPKIGLESEHKFVVEHAHAIEFADEAMPAVLSTPVLIAFLERTARMTIAPLLESAERSVGVHVNIDHLAPTAVGQTVTCKARVVTIDGSTICFQVAASDEKEPIARGFHKRRVVQTSRFSKRVQRKSSLR